MMSEETHLLANTISNFFGIQVDTYTQILQKCHRQAEEIESKSVYIHVCAQYICMQFVYMHTCVRSCVHEYVHIAISGNF